MALEYPNDLKYLDSHEYVRVEGETATIGISAFAVDQLGDIVFVELPDVDETLEKGETFGTVESVKAVEDMYAPVSGTVIEQNTAVVDAPETIVEDPYGAGWLLKIQLSNPDEANDALSADEYRAKVEGE
ncbi:glycine cleavage system H protein [Halothece sp. PCC 7418]|uniref:glycine cleavage system protein GcvH n=1 Tax=Halothece sp. (strain PCC 7418) TaxID=65093 RepID=UPI0002A071F1|nr:glycine cleavage system protein GcvH [Halothece sp. PCC 7418]AFZ43577.1 glycine cleavage system H protein [Halothece sp. PCC 7418]